MSLAGNIPTSISELAKLSDEIWYLAGDTSVDTAWYTKRASLSVVYASTGTHPHSSITGFRDEQGPLSLLSGLRICGEDRGSCSLVRPAFALCVSLQTRTHASPTNSSPCPYIHPYSSTHHRPSLALIHS